MRRKLVANKRLRWRIRR